MPATIRKYVLAVDLGTSGPKVALVGVDGTVLGHEFEPVELLLLPGGGAEQRPDEWWTAITTAARRLLARGLIDRGEVVAVSCTAQWSGTVAVGEHGEPLANAVIWMDSRGSRHVRRITAGWPRIEGYGARKLLKWLRLTGGIPSRSGKDPIAHILYIRAERPEVYAATHKFLEPKDWLNFKLTGRFAASYDSIALHWLTDNRDLRRVAYHPGLIALAGIDRDKLPELVRAVDILGPLRADAASELGLSGRPEGAQAIRRPEGAQAIRRPEGAQMIQVVAGAPDLQSAAVGSGAVGDYQGHLYIGTSSWLTCHVPFKKTDVLRNMTSLPSAIPERYFVANEQETAGACLSFLRDKVLVGSDQLSPETPPEQVFRAFDAMAEGVPAGAGKLIFLPWLYGERTPVEDSSIPGGFFNLSLDCDRPRLVRSVLEGVAFNSRWLLGAVERFIKRPFAGLNMIGGGANSRLWCQIHADVLDREIRQVADPIQANIRGAAMLAAVGLGYRGFDDFAAGVEIRETFRPDPANRRIYDELFGEFLAFYRRNRRAWARLNAGEGIRGRP